MLIICRGDGFIVENAGFQSRGCEEVIEIPDYIWEGFFLVVKNDTYVRVVHCAPRGAVVLPRLQSPPHCCN